MLMRQEFLAAYGERVGEAITVRVAGAVTNLIQEFSKLLLKAKVANIITNICQVSRGCLGKMRVVPGDTPTCLVSVPEFTLKHAC